MADTKLFPIRVYDLDYILISDNDGVSGVVYRTDARLVRDPREERAFGFYEDGYVHRHGREFGPGVVSYSPLDDRELTGYPELKADKTALFRSLGDNN